MSIMGISFPEIDSLLTQDVLIQSQGNTPDGGGGYTTGWITSSTVKGRPSELNGIELYEMEKINPKINSKVFLKKGSVVNNTNRLVIDSKNYDVEFVKNPVSSNEFLICYTVSNGN